LRWCNELEEDTELFGHKNFRTNVQSREERQKLTKQFSLTQGCSASDKEENVEEEDKEEKENKEEENERRRMRRRIRRYRRRRRMWRRRRRRWRMRR